MHKSKKQLTLEGFQKMDLAMLEIILDDSKTYQDARKEVFLEKLSEVFSDFKTGGDTFLSMHLGKCNSEYCKKSGSGYSFIGNHSKNSLDLIFVESENDLLDICHCSCFKTCDDNIEINKSLKLKIFNDEKADFVPSFHYLLTEKMIKQAMSELLLYENEIIDRTIYSEWLKTNDSLFKSLNFSALFHSGYCTFYNTYNAIKGLNDLFINLEAAQEAFEAYHEIDKMEEINLLKWLVKYEKLDNDIFLFNINNIDFEHPEDYEYFIVENFKIRTADFNYLIKFQFIFEQHYWEMLEKYTTTPKYDNIELLNSEEEIYKNETILSYHLKKRGML